MPSVQTPPPPYAGHKSREQCRKKSGFFHPYAKTVPVRVYSHRTSLQGEEIRQYFQSFRGDKTDTFASPSRRVSGVIEAPPPRRVSHPLALFPDPLPLRLP
jgi:hypothetical protein